MDIEELKLSVVLTDNASAQLGVIRSALQDISSDSNQNMPRLRREAQELGKQLKELVKHLGEGQKALVGFIRNAGLAGAAIYAISVASKKAGESLAKFSEELLNVSQAARAVGTTAGQFVTNVEAFERAGFGREGAIRQAQALQDAFVEFNREPGNKIRQELFDIPIEQIPLLEDALAQMRKGQSAEEWFNIIKAYGERVFAYWKEKGEEGVGAAERRKIYEAAGMDPRAREVEDLVKATEEFIEAEERRTKIAEEYFGAKTALNIAIADALRVLNTETMELLLGPLNALADQMEHLAEIVEKGDLNWFDIIGAIPGLQAVKPLTNLPKWEPGGGEHGGGHGGAQHFMSTGDLGGEGLLDPGRPQARSEFLKDTPGGLSQIEDRRGEAAVGAAAPTGGKQVARARLLHENTAEIKRLTDYLLGQTVGAPAGAYGLLSGGGGGGGGALAGALLGRGGGAPMGRLPSFPRGGGGEGPDTGDGDGGGGGGGGGAPAPRRRGRGGGEGPDGGGGGGGGAPAPRRRGRSGAPPGGSPAPGRGPGASLGPQGGPSVIPGAATIPPHGRFVPGPAGPQGKTGPIDTSALGTDRDNEALMLRAAQMVTGEIGPNRSVEAQMAQLETARNRALVRGQGMERILWDTGAHGNRGYYPPGTFRRGHPDLQWFKKNVWDPVMHGGSNVAERRFGPAAPGMMWTGNASQDVAARHTREAIKQGLPYFVDPETGESYYNEGPWWRQVPRRVVEPPKLDLPPLRQVEQPDLSGIDIHGGLTKLPSGGIGGSAHDKEVDDYLWAAYQRSDHKDGSGEFGWKDIEAAKRVGMSTRDYVIGGMSRELKNNLFTAMKEVESKGGTTSILSAFRDDWRQGIASGFKASTGYSRHGGSKVTGGYGFGQAADVDKDTAELIAAQGRRFGLSRPMPVKDPQHIQLRDFEGLHTGVLPKEPVKVTDLKTHPTETNLDKDILDLAMAKDLRQAKGVADVHVKVTDKADENEKQKPPYKDTSKNDHPHGAEKADEGPKNKPEPESEGPSEATGGL